MASSCMSFVNHAECAFGYRILQRVFFILGIFILAHLINSLFISFTNFRRVNRFYGDYMRLLAWQIFSNPMKFLLRLSESLARKSVQPNSWGVWSPCQHIRWLAFVFCVSATVTDQFGHSCVINICNRAIKLQNCSFELPFLNFWPHNYKKWLS